MNLEFRLRQVWTIARLEMRRVFFSKRSFWVYLLALFPTVIFIGHAIEVKVRQQRWAGSQAVSPALVDSITKGEMADEIKARLGPPARDFEWKSGRRGDRMRRIMTYSDGKRQVDLTFEADILYSKGVHSFVDFDESRTVFAGVFDYFYLRLAIFFGCLGIFMNLFRGEMLDKTLHFWFLAPARREVLLAGKYLAGLVAAVVIFAAGTVLAFAAMLWPHDPSEIQAYLQGPGLGHAVSYAGAAVLGCLGYGSVFLASGLLLRNPIIPAVVLLLWEGINGFLPEILQKVSVIYYVQALCPVAPPTDPGMPAILKLIVSPPAPPSAWVAILGLLGVTALVLWAASRAVKRLEINYGTD